MANDPRKSDDDIDRYILKDAVEEAKAMGREGMQHPSTKPVLIGAGVGAVAGGLLLGAWPIGLAAGAGFMLYKRVRP
ncbi:hypothetical protein [Aurantiacibacter sediminis]|uniref:Uncharacterized protein n=1 Tax=Aurantiacibacter sediminis TaxID=2793064 RepID=A0ABS0N3L4_9SPHN|nr:hypothetical protein [Aurantiacibacter sediminis]MBH5322547.1 hypothetical protein [Aurantiacibacter sediminis]